MFVLEALNKFVLDVLNGLKFKVLNKLVFDWLLVWKMLNLF